MSSESVGDQRLERRPKLSERVVALLREHGFTEEARVPDFFRDGVALTFLRLAL